MKKTVICIYLLLALFGAGIASGAVLIDLSAANLPEGQLESWANTGTAGGVFLSADRAGVDDPNAVVEIVADRKAVSFPSGAWMQSDIPAPAALSGSEPWSVLIWVYAPSATSEDCLFQWGDRGGGTAHFNFGTRALTFWDDVFYTNPPATNEWVHLAATYDGTTVRLYVNGIDDTVAARALNTNAGNYMRIARALPDLWGTHPFSGSIASIQVHDTTLTKQQIQALAGLFEAGSLGPQGLSVREGGVPINMTLQINANPLTNQGPKTDLEITLSLVSSRVDVRLGTSEFGQPYVVTVPAASYNVPIRIPVEAEDDTVIESLHTVRVKAVVTAGDADYLGKTLIPINGLGISVMDNDNADCPMPGLKDGAYRDEFDCPRDYMATGTSNSLWSGLLDTAGNTTDATASLTTNGVLRLASANGYWESNNNSGPFLFVNVTGDFEAETYVSEYANSIASQSGVLHNAGGIMVRLGDVAAGGAGEDNIQATYFPIWGVGNILWYNNNGTRTETDNMGTGWGGGRYLKVVRKGANFYCYYSIDGVNWQAFPSASPDNPLVRQDMNVPTLQVGLYQCTFSSDLGFVEYEYFSLKKGRGNISGNLYLTESEGDSGTVQFQFVTQDIPAPAADIQVTLTAIPAAGADPNSEPNDIRIGNASAGQPYTFVIPAAQYAQPQPIQVTAVVDAIREADQQLTLAAQVSSADPNWNGLFISSDALITLFETPGVFVDIQDGVAVKEGGAADVFTARLKIKPQAAVTVAITDQSTPAQVVVDSTSLVFNETNWKTPQVVSVAAVDDGTLENDPHTTVLNLKATNGKEYDELAPVSVNVTILENDCGAWGYLWADFDQDCDVDITDLSQMAADWLDCTRPYSPGCVDLR